MAQVVSIKVHDFGNLEVNKTFRIRKNVFYYFMSVHCV
jgi:hypothetical protein